MTKEMTKEMTEEKNVSCHGSVCKTCSAPDFTPSLKAVRNAQRSLANAHVTGDELVEMFDRMIEKHVADVLAERSARTINEGETES